MSISVKPPIRQGDIVFIPISRAQVPDGLVEVPRDKRGRLIISEGETTGNCHAILEDAATLFRQADLDELEDAFLRVAGEVNVVHEEHATIAPGRQSKDEDWFIVRHKREYRPTEIVRVVD